MVVSLICEPRSGSTNLANWFLQFKEFSVLFEPISNPNTKWFKDNIPPKDWVYGTNHLLVKEVYNTLNEFDDLIKISDKVLCLYRENEKEQIESYCNSVKTNNWSSHWKYNEKFIDSDVKIFFEKLKKTFSEKYLNKSFFEISYEELYYNNGIEKVIEYLEIPILNMSNFPYGKKYRINDTNPTKIF